MIAAGARAIERRSGVDPDAALLARIATGDAAATREIVASKLPRLLSLAMRMLGDRTEAEDVAQDAFLRIWREAPRWRSGEARFDTWLHRVAMNLCYDRLRRRREIVTDTVPDGMDPAPLPDSAMEMQDRSALVERAMQALPPRQREAIVLQYYQELSNMDAADVMQISVEALESLLSRARRSLRIMLGEKDDA